MPGDTQHSVLDTYNQIDHGCSEILDAMCEVDAATRYKLPPWVTPVRDAALALKANNASYAAIEWKAQADLWDKHLRPVAADHHPIIVELIPTEQRAALLRDNALLMKRGVYHTDVEQIDDPDGIVERMHGPASADSDNLVHMTWGVDHPPTGGGTVSVRFIPDDPAMEPTMLSIQDNVEVPREARSSGTGVDFDATYEPHPSRMALVKAIVGAMSLYEQYTMMGWLAEWHTANLSEQLGIDSKALLKLTTRCVDAWLDKQLVLYELPPDVEVDVETVNGLPPIGMGPVPGELIPFEKLVTQVCLAQTLKEKHAAQIALLEALAGDLVMYAAVDAGALQQFMQENFINKLVPPLTQVSLTLASATVHVSSSRPSTGCQGSQTGVSIAPAPPPLHLQPHSSVVTAAAPRADSAAVARADSLAVNHATTTATPGPSNHASVKALSSKKRKRAEDESPIYADREASAASDTPIRQLRSSTRGPSVAPMASSSPGASSSSAAAPSSAATKKMSSKSAKPRKSSSPTKSTSASAAKNGTPKTRSGIPKTKARTQDVADEAGGPQSKRRRRARG